MAIELIRVARVALCGELAIDGYAKRSRDNRASVVFVDRADDLKYSLCSIALIGSPSLMSSSPCFRYSSHLSPRTYLDNAPGSCPAGLPRVFSIAAALATRSLKSLLASALFLAASCV